MQKEEIEVEGWKFKTSNPYRQWYVIEDLFIDAPYSPSHQILAAEAIYDPEFKTMQISCKLRSDFEFHVFFEGYCRDTKELNIIMNLIGLKDEINKKR